MIGHDVAAHGASVWGEGEKEGREKGEKEKKHTHKQEKGKKENQRSSTFRPPFIEL